MEHLRAMPSSSKPSRWARLQTIFDCVDPDFLWSADDPASRSEFLDANPPEFGVEARQQLANLVTYMAGKTGAEELIAKGVKDEALLKSLAAARKPADAS